MVVRNTTETCPDCQTTVTHPDDHRADCAHVGMDGESIAEAKDSWAREQAFEAQREAQR